MTISSTTRSAGPFLGNGVTTAFPFEFKTSATSELIVIRRNSGGVEFTEALGVNYTVTLNSDQENDPGGTVTRTPAIDTGETLTISSDLPYTQNADIVNLSGFYPEVIENALDKLTLLTQQTNDNLNRTLRAPVSDGLESSLTLPNQAARANKILAFDALGAPQAAETEVAYLPTLPTQTGQAGKYLQTDGTTTSWQPVSAIFNTLQAFTSSGTYTPATGVTRVFVEVWGAGGGGGGVVANNRISSGGGAGGYSCGFVDVTAGTPITVTVGTGGAGGANTGANGSAGGTSSFGALSATGGAAGTGSGAGSSDGTLYVGGAGGAGSGGTLNLTGGKAGNSYFSYAPPSSTSFTTTWTLNLNGGDAPRGGIGGTLTEAQTATSTAGIAPGGGGSGARSPNGSGATAGGAGANGLVLVWRP